MKKIVLLALVSLGLSSAFAQSSSPELGVRFGGGYSVFLNAVDGVLPLSDINRLHGDIAIGNNVLAFDLLYEWQFDIGENFSVYPGVGGELFTVSGGGSTIAVLGVIGLEYAIEDVPLTVGLDFRPAIGLTNNAGYGSGGGLMVRYRF